MNVPSYCFPGQDAQRVEYRQQKEQVLDNNAALDRFLARVEKRAYRMTHIATSHSDDALDIIQDAMLTLVRRYAHKPEREWGPLFHRILQNQIRDWYRRQKVRNRLIAWFSGNNEKDDLIQALPAEKRRILRERWRNLAPEQRQGVRERWHNMTSEQRQRLHRRMRDYRNRSRTAKGWCMIIR